MLFSMLCLLGIFEINRYNKIYFTGEIVMGEIVEPRTLSGFMELLPKDQVIFEKIKSEMEKVYQKYGF